MKLFRNIKEKYPTWSLPTKIGFWSFIIGTPITIISIILPFFTEQTQIIGNYNQINQIYHYYSNQTCPISNQSCQNELENELIPVLVDINSLEGNCEHLRWKNEINETYRSGTFSIWAKLEKFDNDEDSYVFDMVDYNDHSFMEIYITNNRIVKLRMHDLNNQEFTLSYDNKVPLNKWFNIFVTWGENDYQSQCESDPNGLITLYINGKSTNSIAIKDADFTIPIKAFYIASSHKKRFCFNGAFDNFLMWDGRLNETQIIEEYESSKNNFN